MDPKLSNLFLADPLSVQTRRSPLENRRWDDATYDGRDGLLQRSPAECRSERKRALHWHSNSAALGDLIAGDRLWVVTSGKSLNHEQEWAGFLVAVWVVEGERRLDKVRIQIDKLPWENWHDIYNEVVQPLANEGAELYCQVVIIAKGDAAIRENTVELGIKESLSQRGIEAIIQTG